MARWGALGMAVGAAAVAACSSEKPAGTVASMGMFQASAAAPDAAPLAVVPGTAATQFRPVQPVVRERSTKAAAAPTRGELRIGRGRYFSFAMPPGWRVGEDGQFALTLLAPGNEALTVMVGNAGVPKNYSAARYAQQKLLALRPENLRLGRPRRATPIAGFKHAYALSVSYSVRGVAYEGVALVSIAPAYDSATMAMTAALAAVGPWRAGYRTWLPQVANQISATNGAAFGMRGIMQQNLRNSSAFAQAARQYRDWSQKTWQKVTDERGASQDRRHFAVREILGGVKTYSNPYGAQAVELPTTYKYYWADPRNNVVGTDDPSANPNVGSTNEWRKMDRAGPRLKP